MNQKQPQIFTNAEKLRKRETEEPSLLKGGDVFQRDDKSCWQDFRNIAQTAQNWI